jgi:hypothetical protein
MLTVEERALVTDMADRLLDLYVQRDEAVQEVQRLQAEIDEVAGEREKIVRSVEAQ